MVTDEDDIALVPGETDSGWGGGEEQGKDEKSNDVSDFTTTQPRDSKLDHRDSKLNGEDSVERKRGSTSSTKDLRSTERDEKSNRRDSKRGKGDFRSTRGESEINGRDSQSNRRGSQSNRRDSRSNRRDSQSNRRDSQLNRRDSRSKRRDSQLNRRDSRSNKRDSQSIRDSRTMDDNETGSIGGVSKSHDASTSRRRNFLRKGSEPMKGESSSTLSRPCGSRMHNGSRERPCGPKRDNDKYKETLDGIDLSIEEKPIETICGVCGPKADLGPDPKLPLALAVSKKLKREKKDLFGSQMKRHRLAAMESAATYEEELVMDDYDPDEYIDRWEKRAMVKRGDKNPCGNCR